MEEKILLHGKGFRIEQSKMTVEHFVWNCPYCNHANRTLEFSVSVFSKKLLCDNCHQSVAYAWDENAE